MRRRTRRIPGAAAIAIGLAVARAGTADTYEWQGGDTSGGYTATDWDNPLNWLVAGRPPAFPPGCSGGPTDADVFVQTAGFEPTTDACAVIDVSAITVELPMAIGSHLRMAAGSSFASVTITGTVEAMTAATYSGVTTMLNGATLAGASGEHTFSGSLTIPGAVQIEPTTVTVHAATTQTASLDIAAGATVTNDGEWQMNGTGLGDGLTTLDRFVNQNAFRRTIIGEVTINATFDNVGIIAAEGGGYRFTGGGTWSGGDITLTNLGFVRTFGDAQAEGPKTIVVDGFIEVTGDGNMFIFPHFRIAGGGLLTANLNPSEGPGLLIQAGGGPWLQLDGPLVNAGHARVQTCPVRGRASLANAEGGTLTLDRADVQCPLQNFGTIEQVNDVSITVDAGAPGSILNHADATYNLRLGGVTGAGSIMNRGTFHKRDGEGTSFESVISAPLHMDGGHLILDGQRRLVLSSDIQSNWEGDCDLSVGASSELRIDRRVNVFGMTTNISSPRETREVHLFGGTLAANVGSAAFVNQGRLRLSSGLVLGRVDNHGVFVWEGGTLMGQSPSNVRNEVGGMVEFTGGTLSGDFLNLSSVGFRHVSGTLALDCVTPGSFRNGGGAVYVALGGSITGSAGPPPGCGFANLPGATFRKESAATFGVDVPFDNAVGTVEVTHGTLAFQDAEANVAQLSGGVLTGGTWIACAGLLQLVGADLVTVGAGARVLANSGSFPQLSGLSVLRGTLTPCGGAIELSTGIMLQLESEGDLDLDLGGTLDAPGGVWSGDVGATMTVIQGGVDDDGGDGPSIAPPFDTGIVAPFVDSYGRLVPGGTDRTSALLITGDLMQRSTGRVEIELGGLEPVTEHDQLLVDGDVSLDGALVITHVDSYEPKVGDAFTVLAAFNGSIAGVFAEVTGPGRYDVAYEADRVVVTWLGPAAPGDVDGDGAVGFDDLLAVLSAWGPCPPPPAACPEDLDGDGDVGLSDLLEVLSYWSET